MSSFIFMSIIIIFIIRTLYKYYEYIQFKCINFKLLFQFFVIKDFKSDTIRSGLIYNEFSQKK